MWGPHKRESCNPNAGPPPPKDLRPCRFTPASAATDTRRLSVERDVTPYLWKPRREFEGDTPLPPRPRLEEEPRAGKRTASYNQNSQGASTLTAKSTTDSRTARTWYSRRTSITSTKRAMTKSSIPPPSDSKPFRVKVGQTTSQSPEKPRAPISAAQKQEKKHAQGKIPDAWPLQSPSTHTN